MPQLAQNELEREPASRLRTTGNTVRYMVVERFKPGAAQSIYSRVADKGRMIPAGVHYIESWVASDLSVCYQLMETDDYALFEQWTSKWADLIDFEIVPLISSDEARARARANS